MLNWSKWFFLFSIMSYKICMLCHCGGTIILDMNNSITHNYGSNIFYWMLIYACHYWILNKLYVMDSGEIILMLKLILLRDVMLGNINIIPFQFQVMWVSGHGCVWYCGSYCGCGLKKVVFIKSTYSWGWVGKIYVWLKLWLKLRLNKK
jgi:hypothetical protein